MKAVAYETHTNNIVIILVEHGVYAIGMVLPQEDATSFRQDIERLRSGDIPITASTLSPLDCFNFVKQHQTPYVTLNDDDTTSGLGSGDSYYDA